MKVPASSPSRQMNDAITADQLGQLLVAMQQMSDSLIAIPDIRKTLGCIMGPPDAEDVVEALASKVVDVRCVAPPLDRPLPHFRRWTLSIPGL